MSATALTSEQSTAIATRDVSIALSAGAGCGKTFVLTERFLSHLDNSHAKHEEPASLRQLIAITFTDAAAREMRTRIRAACYDRLQKAKNADDEQHWLRLLREIDSARISTIHAFCTSLLRAHANEADLDPAFGVLDQSDADVLQYDVIDDVLRELLDKLDPDTLDLASAYGLGRVKEQIAELLGHRHDAAFQNWLAATPEEIVAAWRQWHEQEAFPSALAEISSSPIIRGVLDLLQNVTPSDKKPKFVESRATLLELLSRLCNEPREINDADLDLIRQSAQVQGICTAKDWPTADDYNLYRDACKALRESIDETRPLPLVETAALETARLGLALLKLTAKVADKYEERKRDQGKLDFDDLLARAHRLIAAPKNAKLIEQLADELRLLLVDEFQDTDQLQVDLVRALCGPGFETGRLFFVGDFKQSIYRFRGAEPTVFRNLRSEVDTEGQLPLTVNFRSQPEILHFVNALFHDAFTRDGDPYEKLTANRKQITTPPAVEFLWTITPNKNNRQLAGAVQEARRLEATSIARRIRALIDDASAEMPVIDKHTGEPRRLQLGDIAILFRTLGDVQSYEEALREYGLDYYLVGGYAFYAQQEIFDVLNLLRAVASAADEVSLAGVLRSPFFALADETLFWLADSTGTLNAGLLAPQLPSQLSPEELAKTAAAADAIRHLRAIKDRLPIAVLLNTALDRTGYDAVLLTEFMGERKLANLHKLIERARTVDSAGVTDLDGFITQLAQFIAREPREALAATLPEAANVIRLMTMHHAKGLEFPLVIVPDLDRRMHAGVASAVLHPKLGPLVRNPNDDDKSATGLRMFAAFDHREELEERKRMLYVASTRARDYLVLSSSLESCDAPKSDWLELLARKFNLATGELAATLPADYAVPQIRVTIDPQSDYKPAGRSRGADLLKMLDDAHQLAAAGAGIIPPEISPVPIDRAARRQFSFSRLTGQLVRPRIVSNERGDPTALGSAGGLADEADLQLTPGATAGCSESAVADSPSSASPAPPLLDARSLGLLAHDVLARIDFATRDCTAEINDWCEHLAPQYVVDCADKTAHTAAKMIDRFAASPRGRQLATATTLHRETEFLLAWPPVGLTSERGMAGVERQRAPSASPSSTKYIQGFIDCLYQDQSGAWRIVDYKTNDVSAEDIDYITSRYEMQLYVYALAAERALGTSPTELVLQLLRPGIEHTIPWNDATRTRAIEMVSDAITTSLVAPTTSDFPRPPAPSP
jgi:ATP-dependent helicase/nuclease subunit A